MKPPLLRLIPLLLIAAVAVPISHAAGESVAPFPPEVIAFSKAKEQQMRRSVTNLNLKVTPEVDSFFRAATHADYSELKMVMGRLTPQYINLTANPGNELPSWIPLWQPMTEVEMAYDSFAEGGTKYPLAFGQGIIRSIPPGSIYFGGTEAGRGLVTALCESQAQGRPFFTLTQNALSDNRYLDYVQSIYGGRISLPTTNDIQAAVAQYRADALRRYRHDQDFPSAPRQFKPGEIVRMVDGQAQVTGQVAVMMINERLAKLIWERNSNREFYIEESFPLESIYPYLSPHGFIFKMDHEPVAALTAQILDDDHAFWSNECQSMLGGWLKSETSVSNICAFAETVYGQKDWSNFTGDAEFVTNAFATKAFSKLRVSIAGLYQWRMTNKKALDNGPRLKGEADYAFRQAFALCPNSPEVVFRCVNFLLSENRFDDAILVAGTAKKLAPDNQQFDDLLSQLNNYRAQQKSVAH
jgi:hypothetical protein